MPSLIYFWIATMLGALIGAGVYNMYTPSLTECAKRYNTFECELVAIPKGTGWLLPPAEVQ